MELREKKLTSETLYKGRVITLQKDTVELPNGNTTLREVVRHGGGVAVLALDGDDCALFVRQFRYPYAQVLLELPAGKLEPGEDPAECGKRELEEETGYIPAEFRSLGTVYPSPGYVDEVLHLYLATGLTLSKQKLDDDEFLTAEKIPLETAVGYCLDGTIVDAKSVAAILRYSESRRRGLI